MKRVEELLAKPEDSNAWKILLNDPICDKFERRHKKVLEEEGLTSDGSYYSGQGLLVARFLRGDIFGLDNWDGPKKVAGSIALVKNPQDTDRGDVEFYLSFGVKNALVEFGGYMFAAQLFDRGLLVRRPVLRDDQPILRRAFHVVRTKMVETSIGNYSAGFSIQSLPSYTVKVA